MERIWQKSFAKMKIMGALARAILNLREARNNYGKRSLVPL